MAFWFPLARRSSDEEPNEVMHNDIVENGFLIPSALNVESQRVRKENIPNYFLVLSL